MKLYLVIFVSAAVMAAGCSPSKPDAESREASERVAEPESWVKRGPNGQVLIKLDEQTRKLMGLQTTALVPARLPPQVRAYGRVLDVSSLATAVAEIAAAQATSTASAAELSRLKTLAGQNNASERALQAAEAAAARDKALVESARLKLLGGWGSALADRQDLWQLVTRFSALSACLAQVNVPLGDNLQLLPLAARLVSVGSAAKTMAAQFLGPAPAVDAQIQGRGFMLLVEPNTWGLTPGAAIEAVLSLPGEPQAGVALPSDAVVRMNGAAWVYRQSGDDTFERLPVAAQSPLDEGWFEKALRPGEKVVTVGAQQLLSEELKVVGGEE